MILARTRQELIRQLIIDEIVGCPGEHIDSDRLLQETASLVLCGDYIPQRGQALQYSVCQTMVGLLKNRSAEALWMDLPALGIRGNSHLMKLDRSKRGLTLSEN